ncbi:hypothetical protein ASG43_03330 [Aureimonas sp. Leaf454]|uniref:hypothetical protein n=1 Tax=Aureimonas sp. Leaf454 TaxID=1736381 RepID=UPI0006F45AF0|nr:hypothetical protein [Aureimonas sp. Leaf454]KQT54632.1 hypothetical protein ASG43_03330 [Aureimonas sp. Leaf454]
MDILTLNQLQRLNKGAMFNEYFARKPIFAYYSGMASANNSLNFFADREKRSMKTFLRTGALLPGQPPSYSTYTNTEAAINYWGGAASALAGTSGYSIAGGGTGLSGHSHTMLLNNMDVTAEDYVSFNGAEGVISNTHSGMGVVLGEEGYSQGIDLLKMGTNILVGGVGDVYLSGRTADTNYAFNWTALTGLQRLAGAAAVGHGDIAYNRVTNTLIFLETTNNAAYTYRAHVFKNLPAKIKANALHLKALLEGAIAGQNGSSYEVFDFVWSGMNGPEWHSGTRIIPCDDGTFWMTRMWPSSKIELARITGAAGSRTFAVVASLTLTTSYGRDGGSLYGIRHMVSDDGKFVATYCPYYYYFCGGQFFFTPRDTAATSTRYLTASYTDSSYGMSIAPMGGSNFVLGWANNADSKLRDGAVIDLDSIVLAGQNLTSSNNLLFNHFAVNGYTTSTMYGGNGFIKVQDPVWNTTEWKERT